MHDHDDTSTTARRAARTPVRADRGATDTTGTLGATSSGPAPAVLDPRSRGAMSPGMLSVIQRTAGNSAASRMIQRTSTPTQDVPQSGAQSQAQSHHPYEQTVAEYLRNGGPAKLYRAIRIASQIKRSVGGSEVTAKPDGNLDEGISTRAEVTKVYQLLKQWPETKSIDPVDTNAAFTVAQHVAGDNYGTQYISFSPDQAASAHYAKYNFKDGPAENLELGQTPRSVRYWAPVIEIDVTKLGSGVRLVNLADSTVYGQTDLPKWPEIGTMAKNDREVLIKGTIPGGAVTKVFGVEDVIKSMDLAARKHLIESEYRYGPRPPHGEAKEDWDRGVKRIVPEHFHDYFAHLTEEPEDTYGPPVSVNERNKRRAAEITPSDPRSSSEPVVKKPPKKKKKQSANLLSFSMDDE